MKRFLFSSIGVVTLALTAYATTYMRVVQKDGTIVKYAVDGVDYVDYLTETDASEETTANEHEYVDLELPSGTLWATYNVGATKPEEFGYYFAWGETQPKVKYDWDNYKFSTASWTKYDLGRTERKSDGLSVLLPEDDAVIANWGADWRLPISEEFDELVDYCEYSWTELNGVKGMKFTASNGKYVFFPAAGNYIGSKLKDVGTDGLYWSSSLSDERDSEALHLEFSRNYAYGFFGFTRYYGFSVRAVRAKKSNEISSDITNSDITSSNEKYVDLGLPSGLLWATCNVGATTPEEYGDYFSWGETEPKDIYDRTACKYMVPVWEEKYRSWSIGSLSKYNSGSFKGVVDNLSVLLPEDDAASVNWGAEWRTPTIGEMKELINNTTPSEALINGVKGMKLTGPNNNSIFFPYAGLRDEDKTKSPEVYGRYLSSNVSEDSQAYVGCMTLGEIGVFTSIGNREMGRSVRPVRVNK